MKHVGIVACCIVLAFVLFSTLNAQDETTPTVLLVTNDLWNDGDVAVEERFGLLGFEVVSIIDTESSADWADGMNLVYVSSTVSSGNVTNIFKEVEVPVIMIEPYAQDDMGMTHDNDTTRFFQAFQRDLVILQENHYLAAGLSGEIAVTDNYDIQSGQGVPGEVGIMIAEFIQLEEDSSMIYGAIYAYEKGAMMADSTEAAERRYFGYWNDEGAAYFTEDGWKLWEAAVNWCLYKDQENAVDNVSLQNPVSFQLEQNYPNPFNAETMVNFSCPVGAHVQLFVYDIQGRLVEKLTDGRYAAGVHQVKFNAEGLASGIYFYRLISDDVQLTRKFTLMR
ncbi:T9SS type A sorting domain-containing protein [candidate division KSB1 bacterium]|nr:T9SS type A sorting domain-containing protein [candidate division KSB1 bacterium]